MWSDPVTRGVASSRRAGGRVTLFKPQSYFKKTNKTNKRHQRPSKSPRPSQDLTVPLMGSRGQEVKGCCRVESVGFRLKILCGRKYSQSTFSHTSTFLSLTLFLYLPPSLSTSLPPPSLSFPSLPPYYLSLSPSLSPLSLTLPFSLLLSLPSLSVSLPPPLLSLSLPPSHALSLPPSLPPLSSSTVHPTKRPAARVHLDLSVGGSEWALVLQTVGCSPAAASREPPVCVCQCVCVCVSVCVFMYAFVCVGIATLCARDSLVVMPILAC